ncbi:MAG: hypothetical protein ACOX8E_13170 [Ruminococcus sp.]|jgi:hypothetical protein
MKWKDKCFTALDAENMFENSGHRTRFKELMDCYSSYPFFNKGLCKCMYLSAWDEEHFCIMLETLSEMSLGKEKTTQEMRSKGDLFAEEQTNDEAYVYELSNSFLDNKPFHLKPEEASNISSEIRYIVSRALTAGEIIDSL